MGRFHLREHLVPAQRKMPRLVKHVGKASAKVRQETYRASNLEQGGLEVRITVHCAISTQKAQFLTRLKQLINKRWRDPRDFNDSEHYNKRKGLRQS